jgi:hypothetical protein
MTLLYPHAIRLFSVGAKENYENHVNIPISADLIKLRPSYPIVLEDMCLPDTL